MRSVAALTIALSLTACTSTNSPVTANWATAKWTAGCQGDQHDPYGKLVERAKCWTMVSDFTRHIEGLSVGVATIFEVNANGTRMVNNRAFDTDICNETPRRIAVDGRRIDTLPMPERIEAALSGELVVREKDRPWPYCNVHNETIHMAGAREAYNQMLSGWQDMNE